MIATLGKWEIRTDLSKRSGSNVSRIYCFDLADANASPCASDIEQEAGDFIARHVLENDTSW